MTTLLLLLVMLSNLTISGAGRLPLRIQMLAVQGAVLCLLPLFFHARGYSLHAVFIAFGTAAIKIYYVPELLRKAERLAVPGSETTIDLGVSTHIFLGVLSLAAAFWLNHSFIPQQITSAPLFAPATLATVFLGVTLITGSRQFLSQVVGYLVLANGMFITGVFLAPSHPQLVELGLISEVLLVGFLMH